MAVTDYLTLADSLEQVNVCDHTQVSDADDAEMRADCRAVSDAASALRRLHAVREWAVRNKHQGGWKEAGTEVLDLVDNLSKASS